MKALTLTQPWADAVALGYKRVETRSWSTNWRGPIAIHAAQGFPQYAREFAATELALGRGRNPHPRAAIVAVATVVGCRPTEDVALELGVDGGLERYLGDYTPGRWAWLLDDVHMLHVPIPCRGALSLWEVPPEVVDRVMAQVPA